MVGRNLHLLLVEDNDGDAHLIRAMLDEVSSPVELIHVRSLDEGVKRLTAGSFDAVLLDLGLPDSQGLESVTTTHLFDTETPIIVLTGLDDDQAAFDALRSGAQDYLVKGKISGRDIVRTVRFAQQRAQAQAALAAQRGTPRAAMDAAVSALACPSGSSAVETIAERLTQKLGQGRQILYVSFDRPASVLAERFAALDLAMASLHFIDVSGEVGPADGPIFTPDDPRDLAAVAVEIENGCAALGPDTHVMVDSINSLILHHGVEAAAVFGHMVANRLRLLGISADFVGQHNQEWPFILDRFSFLDGEVHLGQKSAGPDPSVA